MCGNQLTDASENGECALCKFAYDTNSWSIPAWTHARAKRPARSHEEVGVWSMIFWPMGIPLRAILFLAVLALALLTSDYWWIAVGFVVLIVLSYLKPKNQQPNAALICSP